MPATRWIIAVLACSVLAATAAWFIAKQTDEPPGPNASEKPLELTAAELLQQARHLLGSPHSAAEGGVADQRVDQLRRMAAIRQAEHPQEIPAAWDQFGKLLADLRGPAAKGGAEDGTRLVQLNAGLILLMRYDDDLDDAALASRSAEDFDLVWQIKGRVAVSIQQSRAELLQQIQGRFAQITGSQKDQDTVTELKEFAVLKKDLDGPVVALVATLDSADEDESLLQILSNVAIQEERVLQAILALQEKTAEFEKQLREPDKRVEPKAARADGATNSTENVGTSEMLLHELRELEEALTAADLASWRTIHDRLARKASGQTGEVAKLGATIARDSSPPALSTPGEDELSGKITLLADKLYGLQHLAYNLWALREIAAAEADTDNWDVPLARIDTGLLHPTVAALYSSTYEKQIKVVDDPTAVSAKAKHVLSNPKVGLSAF